MKSPHCLFRESETEGWVGGRREGEVLSQHKLGNTILQHYCSMSQPCGHSIDALDDALVPLSRQLSPSALRFGSLAPKSKEVSSWLSWEESSREDCLLFSR